MPVSPDQDRQYLRHAARLGGFLGRKGDGEPGVKALWIALQRLDDISMAWLAFGPHNAQSVEDTS